MKNKNQINNNKTYKDTEDEFVHIMESTMEPDNELITNIANLLGNINTQEKNKTIQKLQEDYNLEKNSDLYLIYFQFQKIFPQIESKNKVNFLNLLLNNNRDENNKLFEEIEKQKILSNKKSPTSLFERIKELNQQVNGTTSLDLDTYDIVTRKEVAKDTPPNKFR